MENIITLNNLNPNGTKRDLIYLTSVPNADYSGMEYLIEFCESEGLKKVIVGRVSLIDGVVRFAENYYGVTHTGLKLLAVWIENNME
jgi:hypothetical protein